MGWAGLKGWAVMGWGGLRDFTGSGLVFSMSSRRKLGRKSLVGATPAKTSRGGGAVFPTAFLEARLLTSPAAALTMLLIESRISVPFGVALGDVVVVEGRVVGSEGFLEGFRGRGRSLVVLAGDV